MSKNLELTMGPIQFFKQHIKWAHQFQNSKQFFTKIKPDTHEWMHGKCTHFWPHA